MNSTALPYPSEKPWSSKGFVAALSFIQKELGFAELFGPLDSDWVYVLCVLFSSEDWHRAQNDEAAAMIIQEVERAASRAGRHG